MFIEFTLLVNYIDQIQDKKVTMKNFIAKTIAALMLFAAAACNSSENKPQSLSALLSEGRWIDLSYDFSSETIYWPNNPKGFQLDTQANGITPAGFFYASNAFSSPEHGGTHIDAPIHFAHGKWTLDQIPLEKLIGEAVVIDVAENANNNPDYRASIADIEAWEKMNGKIPDNAFLFIRTGWGKYYPDPAKYIGTAEKGEQAVPKLHFPGAHPDLAAWLVKNRKIKALGIDTPSIDYGQSNDFKSHQVLYAENIAGFENLANLDQLPAKGAFIVALPMKIKNGTGGPLRIVAWTR
jgi:kynurenine formamidase